MASICNEFSFEYKLAKISSYYVVYLLKKFLF